MERKNSQNIDTSYEEESSEDEREEVAEEVKVLKMLMKASNRPRVEVPMYEGNLNVEEIMDQINALNKYFDFEEIEDKKKVRYATTKLKDMQLQGGMNFRSTEKEEVILKSNLGIKCYIKLKVNLCLRIIT